jgi:CRP-like cAMP-binding protein
MLTYEFFPARSVVIREGDPSNNKFYILLDGRVTVYIKPKKRDTPTSKNRPNPKEEESLGTAVNILYSGDHFGEKVLLETAPDARRNASIYANVPLHHVSR